MTSSRREKLTRIAVGLASVALITAAAFVAANRFVAHYVHSPDLLQKIGARTARKLEGHAGYLPLTTHGLSFFSPGFVGNADPPRALTELRADRVLARCSLVELWHGKWRIDALRIEHLQAAFGPAAAALIRRDEFPMPELQPAATSESILTVDVRDTTIARTDLLWGDPKKDGGAFHDVVTELLTQNKDLIVHGHGGTFQKAKFPQMRVEAFKLFYAKPELRIDEGSLSAGGKSRIGVSGWMKFEQDESMNLALKFERCPIAPFLSEAQRGKIDGAFEGTTTIERAPAAGSVPRASGSLVVLRGLLQNFAALKQAAAFTGAAELDPLKLDVATGTYTWTPDRLDVRDLVLERKKVICVKGGGALRGENVDATVQLGVSPAIVDKFPGAREEVFTRSEGGYLWTPVRITGTTSNPRNDLKDRLLAAVEHHFAKSLLAPITQPGKAAREAIGLLFP